jgi:flagellin
LRINSAKDDAAGLAISNRMTAQVRGFSMATKNANDGISMAQTADGAYGQVTSMLQRMRELSVQAANGSMTKNDRESIQLEIDELKMEIHNVATKTNFNGINLLDGSARDIKLQTGTKEGDLMSIGFGSVQTKDIGSGAKPALTSIGGNVTSFGALSSGQVVLNGVIVGASLHTDDNLSFQTAGATTSIAASAIAKAAAINRVSDQSGVYARVNDTTVRGTSMTASASVAGAAITINGTRTAEVALSTDASTNRVAIVGAINAISAQTGVQAFDTGEDTKGITLVAQDGRNITVALGTGQTAKNTGLGAAGTYICTFSLYSSSGAAITI